MHRNTRNDKTSLPKEVRDFIAAQESGSIQDLYDQGVIKGKPPKNMEEGGEAISDADIASVRRAFGSRGGSGGSISDTDMARLEAFLGKKRGNIPLGTPQSLSRKNKRRRANESANTISDRDIQMIMQSIGMEDGGEAVPAKFKGFSKLPESVQQKMDPDLAQKYEKGGAVGSCRGMGAALRGGKFSGVK